MSDGYEGRAWAARMVMRLVFPVALVLLCGLGGLLIASVIG